MVSETIIQGTKASVAMLKAIIEKYDLPEDDVFELASIVFKENMQNGTENVTTK